MSEKQTTNYCPLCEGYTKRISELEARVAEAEALNEQQAEDRDREMQRDYVECIEERDRYRKALERIANYNPPEMMSHKVWRWRINWLRDKARNALDAQKGGEG